MVNKTINEFSNLVSIASDDYLLTWDTSNSTTLKVSADNLISANLITSDKIPSLDASKITTGALSSSNMIPNIDASKITTGTLSSSDMIPNLDMNKITTGNLNSSRITGNITNNITYSTSSSDNSYNGIVTSLPTLNSCTFGEIRYLDTNYLIIASNSMSSSASGMLCFVTESASAYDYVNVLLNGIANDSAWSFTRGDKIYLGTSGLTSSIPSSSGSIVRLLGYALSSSSIYFNPDNTYVELS